MEALASLETLFYLRRKPSGSWGYSERAPGKSPGLERAIYLANWIEENLWIATKDRRVVRLRFNEAQGILLQYLAYCWHHKLPVQVLIPKARQEGVSTFWQAVAFALCVLNDRADSVFRSVTIAHIESSATTIFRMSRMFEKRLPNEWAAPLESRQQGCLEWSGGSWVRVATARAGDRLEKGSTLNMIHGSEVANWADDGVNPEDPWGAVQGALADDEHAIVVLESTAKGRDPFFFARVEQALKKENTFRVLFLPWFLEKGYSMPWAEYRRQRLALGWDASLLPETFVPTPEEVELRAHLRDAVVAPGDEWHTFRCELTDDQLVWRRHTIEKKYDGKIDNFKMYYPATLEEAFAASASSMFSQETIAHYWQSSNEDFETGDVELDGTVPRWEKRDEGALRVWRHPEQGREYVVAGDVSEGLATGDEQAAYVVDKLTLEAVAVLAGRWDPDLYADKLNAVGRYYNLALLAPENTFDPGVCVRLKKKHRYPRLYYYTDPEKPRARPDKPGWSTNRKTRRLILGVLAAVARDRDLKVYDLEFAKQMNVFLWNERKGRYEAANGKHDDRILAMAIAVWLTGARAADGRRKAVPIAKAKAAGAYEAFLAEQAAQERAEREERRRRRPRTRRGGPIFLGT